MRGPDAAAVTSNPAVKALSPTAVRMIHRTSGSCERFLKISPRSKNILCVYELSFLGLLTSTTATYSYGKVTLKCSELRSRYAMVESFWCQICILISCLPYTLRDMLLESL